MKIKEIIVKLLLFMKKELTESFKYFNGKEKISFIPKTYSFKKK